MRHPTSPWKWPVVILLAFAFLFGGVFFTPRSWIDFFFSPLSLELAEADSPPRGWLEILPPPEIQVAQPEPEPEPENIPPPEPEAEWTNPDWWKEGWKVRMETQTTDELRASVQDSVAVVLQELGIGQDFMTKVKPDSVLAARLLILKLEDSYRFDELKPYFLAMGRAEQYRDIMSRKADMYDDFLSREIIAPDASNR